MQPYFFPYIGYFQLMNAVDKFIVYDNIQYTKKGWINRNRILQNGVDSMISLPIKKDSDYLNVVDRRLADTWPEERTKMLNRIAGAYRKAPHFEEAFQVIEKCILLKEDNLYWFINNSLFQMRNYLGMFSPLITSSWVEINHDLRSKEKVIELCKAKNADTYINPIGGLELYNREEFKEKGIDLFFCKSNPIEYPQFGNKFVPWLSVIDVIMFNSKEKVSEYLNNYSLV